MFVAETQDGHTVFAVPTSTSGVLLQVYKGTLPDISSELVIELEFNINEARDLGRAIKNVIEETEGAF